MRTLRLVIVMLGVGLAGCKGPATGVGSTRARASGSPGVSESDALAPALSATHFWVANGTLVAYDLDGTRVASLGDEPVDRAHRLADGRVVGLVESDEHALTLVVLDAAGARTQRIEVANFFDPEPCTIGAAAPSDPDSYAQLLQIHDPGDFGIGVGAACLTLQDRNVNMANYELSVVVDLETGGLEARVGLDLEGECEGKQLRQGIVEGDCAARADSQPWVVTVGDQAPAREDWPARFDEATRSVVRAGQEPVRLCIPGHVSDPGGDWGACAEFESSSTSGRWSLLSGNRTEGDYIYRDLLLLDRSDGTLLQVGESMTFVEVTPAQVFADEPEQGCLALIGESEVVWLPGDRLWVDGLLLIPERREIVELGGNLARAVEPMTD